jgi:hypothetical protein
MNRSRQAVKGESPAATGGDRDAFLRRAILASIAAFATVIFSWSSVPLGRADVSEFDFASVTASLSTTQAGGHPNFTTTFVLMGDPSQTDAFGQAYPWGSLRNLSVELPAGLTGDPKAFPTCSTAVFANSIQKLVTGEETEQCPTDSQLGLVEPGLWNLTPPGGLREPLYNLESPGGDVVARLGFWGFIYPIFIDIKVDPQRDNALTATVVNSPSTAGLTATNTTIWGVPTAVSHNEERFNPVEAVECGGPCDGPVPTGLAQTAFMSNPTSCGPKEQVGFTASNYDGFSATPTVASLPDVVGCESVPFEPTMSLTPTSRHTSSASGLDVELTVPQESLTDPDGVRTSDLKDARVTLPEGISLNTSAADGLGACSEAEIGLTSLSPVRFDSNPASCPDSSKVGTVKITTPVLDEPLEGSLYVAMQEDNPFNSLLAGYIVVKGKGVLIKQAARFDLNPRTGQIVATVENALQQPFSALEMHFKGGPRGVLQTPSACDTYISTYELAPWSGNDPVEGTSPFQVDEGCNTGGFDPRLSAGATNPIGGRYSPFVFDVSREDGEQNVAALEVILPKGETAKLAGVPLCPEAATASGNCPAASQIGVVKAATGAGSLPLWIPQPGKHPTAVYLAGPYKGAPYSIVAMVPAEAGPFDLGVVTVRSGIYVDPGTAQVTVQSDSLPQILKGIPVFYRRVHVDVDRSGFSLNPTSCNGMSVAARVASAVGGTASPSDRFQVGGCRELGFTPKLFIRLFGPTKRGKFPRLRATVQAKQGEANIAKTIVTLPHSAFLEQGHIGTVCTRVQFAEGRNPGEKCPAASIYGHAKAFTPLLEEPLEGPVVLRSSSRKLPDLVVAMHGQVNIDLVGFIDSVHGRLRTRFHAVPDVPVRKFVLTMKGGKKGLLVNSIDICREPQYATVKMDGHNGKVDDFRPLVKNDCGKSKRHH